MQGGKHHEPSVFTHFVPGLLSGFVVGGIVATLVISHIASTSLQFFWQAVHETKKSNTTSCADVSGLQITSEVSDTGSVLTSVMVGDGNETLLTVPVENIRYVPSSGVFEAYLTAVASSVQQGAFPAASLYRVDYCAKTVTHVLGNSEESVEVLGMSSAGNWVVYMRGENFMMMQADDGETIVPPFFASSRPEEVLFSPTQEAVALRYVNGERAVWNMGEHGYIVSEEVGAVGDVLPAWGVQSPVEYLANLQ